MLGFGIEVESGFFIAGVKLGSGVAVHSGGNVGTAEVGEGGKGAKAVAGVIMATAFTGREGTAFKFRQTRILPTVDAEQISKANVPIIAHFIDCPIDFLVGVVC